MAKLTTEEYIKKAREVHGNRYDYSKVKYVDSQTKVTIICPMHGEFSQSPTSHLQGSGCPKCGNDRTALRMNNEGFINKAKAVHGDRYDYSKVQYVYNKTEVCIICREHGEFWQKPKNHLSGYGCPICSGRKKMRTSDFIKKLAQFMEKSMTIQKQNTKAMQKKFALFVLSMVSLCNEQEVI
jgi:Zn finger protein HypA/HybF involved in hydrogenase expression